MYWRFGAPDMYWRFGAPDMYCRYGAHRTYTLFGAPDMHKQRGLYLSRGSMFRGVEFEDMNAS